MKTSNQHNRELDKLVYWGLITLEGNPHTYEGQQKLREEAEALIVHHLELETVKAREDSTKWALNRLLEIEKGIRTHDEVKEMFYERLAQLKASTEATKDTE